MGTKTFANDKDETMEIQEEKRIFQSLLQEREDMVDPFYNQGLLADNKIDEVSFRKWLRGIK